MIVSSKPDNAIEIVSLTKDFGKVRALDELDMTVRTGEVHGFLGSNGSGKSTAIRILLVLSAFLIAAALSVFHRRDVVTS